MRLNDLTGRCLAPAYLGDNMKSNGHMKSPSIQFNAPAKAVGHEVVVEIRFVDKSGRVTNHTMRMSRQKLSRSKTTIGELYRRFSALAIIATVLMSTGSLTAQPVTFPAVGTLTLTTNSYTNGIYKDRTITTYYGEQISFKGTNSGIVHEQSSNFVGRVESRRQLLTEKGWVWAPMYAPFGPSGIPPLPTPQEPNPRRITE